MVKNRDCRYLTEPQVLVLVLSVCFGDSLCLARTFTLVSTLHAVLNNQCFVSLAQILGELFCIATDIAGHAMVKNRYIACIVIV